MEKISGNVQKSLRTIVPQFFHDTSTNAITNTVIASRASATACTNGGTNTGSIPVITTDRDDVADAIADSGDFTDYL